MGDITGVDKRVKNGDLTGIFTGVDFGLVCGVPIGASICFDLDDVKIGNRSRAPNGVNMGAATGD
jgi:hypothetical protein